MNRRNIFIVCLFSLFAFPALLPAARSLLEKDNSLQIKVDNRIVAKVNGKAISIVDVMKKMDIAFLRQFSQYAGSPEVRLQFYQLNWQKVLRDLIDKELILADANAVKLPVSSADVRQEMERMFGPGIIANLDQIDMPFEEAREIIEGDIIIRRMLYLRVHSKATSAVTPQMIRTAYEEYSQKNLRQDEWVYSVLSVRDKDPVTAAEAANNLYHMLSEQVIPLEDIKAAAAEQKILAETTVVNVSEEFKQPDKDISPSHKQGLQGLTPGEYSMPIAQQSKDKAAVFRIFFLKAFTAGGTPDFKEVEDKLKDQLIEVAAEREADRYITQLQKQFTIEANILDDPALTTFQPFTSK